MVKLGTLIKEMTIKTVVNNQYEVLTSSQNGLFSQEDYFNKQIASKNNIGYKVIKKGQFTYRSMSDTGLFYVNRLIDKEIGIVSPAYPVFDIVSSEVIPEYVELFFKTKLFQKQISNKSVGSTRLSLRFSKLKEVAIPVPNISFQRKIVENVELLNACIIHEKTTLSYYDELIKSRFNEMFGEVTKLTSENGICLGKICKTIGGGTPSTKYPEFYKGDIPWISTVALGPNFIDGKNAKGFITEEAVEKSATHLIPKGSIMIGTRVGVGKCSINLIDMCTNQDINSIVELNENYSPLFIKYCLDCYQFYFASIKKGATILGITSDDLKKVLIPIISIDAQNQFVSFVEQVDKLKFNVKKRIELYQELLNKKMDEYFD